MPVIIPTKPHSTEGIISTAVDSDYLQGNLKAFDPYGQIIGGTTTLWDLVIYLAQTAGVSVKDEKKIETNEIAAAKIYPAALMSYLQALRAQKNIIDLVPIFVINVTTSDGIFAEDEWFQELNMGNHGSFPSVVGIENFITRINPIWTNAYPYELLNYPGSYYIQWVPNKTTAEMRALRVILGTYAEAYQTFCNKVKIKTHTLDVNSFVNREVPKFQPLDFGNKDWLYWNFTGHHFSIRNGAHTGYNKLTARRYAAAEVFEADVANWLSARDKYYVIPKDGIPSDLVAITQMFYQHHANNLLGAVVADDGGGINDDTLEAADVIGYRLSRSDPGSTNDTVATVIDRGDIGTYQWNSFPAHFTSQAFADAAMTKGTEEAGETTLAAGISASGGLRILNFDTAIWDNTNALLVQSFFQDMFGKSVKGVAQPKERERTKLNEMRPVQ